MRAKSKALGCETTLDYVVRAAEAVLDETGLLPHLNPGVLTREDAARLRGVSASMGLMLETTSDRLSARGGPHFGSPDKIPARRLETLAAAGEARVPFTTGILIGIGESRAERIEALLTISELADRYGHVQEVIVQNFRAKPGMHGCARAAARGVVVDDRRGAHPVQPLISGSAKSVHDDSPRLLDAGSTTGAACRR